MVYGAYNIYLWSFRIKWNLSKKWGWDDKNTRYLSSVFDVERLGMHGKEVLTLNYQSSEVYTE